MRALTPQSSGFGLARFLPGAAFSGSRRKMAALREKLIAEGIDAAAIDRIKAPAGLDLGAITPEEIAMSILAEIAIERRRGQRGAGKAQVA
jgi:xanthine dehydrogenase accessory factor